METINFKLPQGFESGATHAGFKPGETLDLAWLVSKTPAAAAGVYTKNQFQAAPTQFTKKLIQSGHQLQAIVVNAGNANAFTGEEGLANTAKQNQLVADQLGIDPALVGVASTGVIGKQLDMNVFKTGLGQLQLSATDETMPEAILTTDTHAKKISVTLTIDGQEVTVTGFTKGSGMIHPNMGTTLGFISTDAKVDPTALQSLLSELIQTSYNQVTVDGCMSTNDMVVVLANGQAGNDEINASHPQLNDFKDALNKVLTTLAKMVAADGEGANKLVEARVINAQNKVQANQVAKAIVGSNLIKAMLFGEDGNWGRIVQAVGQTQAALDPNHLAIQIGSLTLVKDSLSQTVDQEALHHILAQDHIEITVDLNIGSAQGLAWGCDLTYKYVEINAAYEG
ncbi:bifunctional glutamate N-acetyltransferase/amino-acid acetyltransferase ArgJ [Lactobacillaceae bacterium L1_55_11]|nr:bifunctional glutamate N-acetyltransferase/amino-acid acetyltransferase ArgJ [Lactobacillaceae bacterium L1_55_11]